MKTRKSAQDKVIPKVETVPKAPDISLAKIPTLVSWKNNSVTVQMNISKIKEGQSFILDTEDIFIVMRRPKNIPETKVLVRKINS